MEFINLNGMSTCLGLFYAKRLGNHIHIYISSAVVHEEFFFFAYYPNKYK